MDKYNIAADTSNVGDFTAIESIRNNKIEQMDAIWIGEDPLTKDSQIVKGSTILIEPE